MTSISFEPKEIQQCFRHQNIRLDLLNVRFGFGNDRINGWSAINGFPLKIVNFGKNRQIFTWFTKNITVSSVFVIEGWFWPFCKEEVQTFSRWNSNRKSVDWLSRDVLPNLRKKYFFCPIFVFRNFYKMGRKISLRKDFFNFSWIFINYRFCRFQTCQYHFCTLIRTMSIYLTKMIDAPKIGIFRPWSSVDFGTLPYHDRWSQKLGFALFGKRKNRSLLDGNQIKDWSSTFWVIRFWKMLIFYGFLQIFILKNLYNTKFKFLKFFF